MNKKLFFAGFALLAAVSFTSCNSDNPIDITNPNGVTPAAATHYVGGEYDWTAIAKDYTQLKEFWAADKKDVKDAIAKKGTIDILLDVSGYELKAGDVITLPDFWQTGATNGKVVNITFQGNFKNADFERANAIDKNDVAADMSKFPVTIDADNLKGAEVNFTFNVEKFDLNIVTTEARSTFAGNYTIGYMFGAADTGKDALEVKEGTVEGIDLQSTGEYKGTFAGVWSKGNENFTVAANGIKLVSGKVASGSKDVYLEATAWVDTWYEPNTKTNLQYKLGTVKFVQKAGTSIWLVLNGTNNNGTVTEDAIENVVGFNKADCGVWTGGAENALKNIDSMEKVTINGTATLKLTKDIFSDVRFAAATKYTTKDIDTFADVTFGALTVTVHADDQTLTYNGVNFGNMVTLKSGIKETEQTGYNEWLYQWIIDNTATGAGHFALVDDDNPVLDANKDKTVVQFADTDIVYDGAGSFTKPAGSTASTDDLNAAKAAYLVLITHTATASTTYIPEGTNVQLNSCKFQNATTNIALNNIWGNKEFWDEQCWYTVYVDGTKYNWKKKEDGGSTSKVKFVLYPPTAE